MQFDEWTGNNLKMTNGYILAASNLCTWPIQADDVLPKIAINTMSHQRRPCCSMPHKEGRRVRLGFHHIIS